MGASNVNWMRYGCIIALMGATLIVAFVMLPSIDSTGRADERAALTRARHWAMLDGLVQAGGRPIQPIAERMLQDCRRREQAMLQSGYLWRKGFKEPSWTRQHQILLMSAARRSFSKDWYSIEYDQGSQVLWVTSRPELLRQWAVLIETLSSTASATN